MKISRVSEEVEFNSLHKIMAKKNYESPDEEVIHVTLNPGENLKSHVTPFDVLLRLV